MNYYRNAEGYYDPSAGAALEAIARAGMKERKKQAEIAKRNEFEELCRQFAQTAKEHGFEFPGQIWLRDKRSGLIFKGK